MVDYSIIDNPLLLRFLFFPRKDFNPCPGNAFDLMVPAAENIYISCRLYIADKTYPSILYFHGNGEVVSDYDDIAPFYNEKGLNLAVADYRGYGASGGFPSFANLIRDAHSIFKTVRKELFIIPYADHNNIMFLEPEEYFGKIKEFINKTME